MALTWPQCKVSDQRHNQLFLGGARKGGLQAVGTCAELPGHSIIGPSTAGSMGPTAGEDRIMG